MKSDRRDLSIYVEIMNTTAQGSNPVELASRTLRARFGTRAVITLQNNSLTKKTELGEPQVRIAPAAPGSYIAVLQAIDALERVGVDAVRVVSNKGSYPVDVNVYTSAITEQLCVHQKQPALVWFHADWSVESELATQRVLASPQLWESLTSAGLPLVLLDMTSPNKEQSFVFRSVVASQRVPTAVLYSFPEGRLQSTYFELDIELEPLLAAITQMKEQNAKTENGSKEE